MIVAHWVPVFSCIYHGHASYPDVFRSSLIYSFLCASKHAVQTISTFDVRRLRLSSHSLHLHTNSEMSTTHLTGPVLTLALQLSQTSLPTIATTTPYTPLQKPETSSPSTTATQDSQSTPPTPDTSSGIRGRPSGDHSDSASSICSDVNFSPPGSL